MLLAMVQRRQAPLPPPPPIASSQMGKMPGPDPAMDGRGQREAAQENRVKDSDFEPYESIGLWDSETME